MNENRSVVVLDTNAYRSLASGQPEVDTLVRRDTAAGVQPLCSPYVVIELLAHVASSEDQASTVCRSAIRTLWTHCTVGNNGRLALIADPETGLCQTLFGRRPAGHDEVTERLAIACRGVALSRDIALPSALVVELADLSRVANEIEERFAQDVLRWVVQACDPRVTDWQSFVSSRNLRNRALAIIDHPTFVERMAEGQVAKARWLLGLQGPDPNTYRLAQGLLSRCSTPLHLWRLALRRIVADGARLSNSRNRNWIWDINISFCVGDISVSGGRDIYLVTGDRAIVEAAREAGSHSRVVSLENYVEYGVGDRAEESDGDAPDDLQS